MLRGVEIIDLFFKSSAIGLLAKFLIREFIFPFTEDVATGYEIFFYHLIPRLELKMARGKSLDL